MQQKPKRSQKQAAEALRLTTGWLSQVLNDEVDASTELYRDMVEYAKGALTMKELVAFRKPSPHRRRKLIAIKKPAKRRAPDLATAEPAKGPDGKPPLH